MNRFWKDKTALVTGSTGFVGSHITRLLIENGAKVVCLHRDVNHKSAFDVSKVSVIKGEIEDFALLKSILKDHKIDSVFHLAAQALAGAGNRSPLSTFETNVRGTYILLEACRLSANLRSIVIASSENSYGSNQLPPFSEDFPLQGRSPYETSKSCGDLIAQSFAITYDLPVTIVRSANTYGGGDLNLSRIVPGTILSVLKDERPIIRSDGTPIREFIHIQDVAEAFLILAQNIEQSKGEAFNLGSNEPIQMLDLVKQIIKLMGKSDYLGPNVLVQPDHAAKIDAQYLSSEKMKKYFNWSAKINLTKGLTQTIEWYQRHFQDFT